MSCLRFLTKSFKIFVCSEVRSSFHSLAWDLLRCGGGATGTEHSSVRSFMTQRLFLKTFSFSLSFNRFQLWPTVNSVGEEGVLHVAESVGPNEDLQRAPQSSGKWAVVIYKGNLTVSSIWMFWGVCLLCFVRTHTLVYRSLVVEECVTVRAKISSSLLPTDLISLSLQPLAVVVFNLLKTVQPLPHLLRLFPEKHKPAT